MTRSVSIAILAGGQSSRMGRDKALLELEPDSKPLLEIVLERVQPLSDDVFVVASGRDVYARFGAPVRPDLYPGAAVLGGIGSAIRHAAHDACLVVSCDHPFLNPTLLSRMIQTLGDWDVLVPVIRGESRQGGKAIRQTLHAIYARSCVPYIERAIAGEKLQIVSFFGDVRVNEIDEAEIAKYDPDFRSFFSMNTPEALVTANRWRTSESF
jgi:molybdenum cofactor guanylyltransferase